MRLGERRTRRLSRRVGVRTAEWCIDETKVLEYTCPPYELRIFKSYVYVRMTFIFHELGDFASRNSNGKSKGQVLFKKPVWYIVQRPSFSTR